MDYIYSDGGKNEYCSAAGISENRDCTVRALSIALDLPYYQVHQELKLRGRKNNHGVHLKIAINKDRNFLGKKLTIAKRSGSLGKFIQDNPVGRFIVTVRSHAFAVIDGLVHDMEEQSPKRHLMYAWKISTDE